MRFVIDAANETTMVQEVGVTNDGKTYVNCHYVTDLDELTPDYIRKHFGQIIDMAIRALKQSESNAVELISKQEAINVCERVSNDKRLSADGNLGAEECRERIMKLPPIQPKRGHWIEADVCGDTTSWECSCCHNWTGLPTGWNVKTKLWFCPKCTADMREVTG